MITMNPEKVRTAIDKNGVERVIRRCRECGVEYPTGRPVVRVSMEAWRARVAFDKLYWKIPNVAICFLVLIMAGTMVAFVMDAPQPFVGSFSKWLREDDTVWRSLTASAVVTSIIMGLPLLFLWWKWRQLVRKFPILKRTWDELQPLPPNEN